MDRDQLRRLASAHLVPLFSGARLEPKSSPAGPRHDLVAFHSPIEIRFRVARSDPYRLAIKRSQSFDTVGGGRATEKSVVDAFVSVVGELEPGLDQPFASDLLSTFPRRVVARSLVSSPVVQATILNALDQLSLWSTRLYEGREISAAIGIEPESGTGEPFNKVMDEDLSAVMSNGFDTLIVFGRNGHFRGHATAAAPVSAPSFAPFRQAGLAAWASDGKVALSLNRLGEISIFKDERLVFTRRSGQWHFLTHEPVVKQLGKPQRNPRLRLAAYESALDASFARSGACVGIVTSPHMGSWKALVPESGDRLGDASSPKSRTITDMIAGRKFQDLDRRLRQELLAIDGATLLDYQGNFLAVGAILKIPGGSTGGGRRAAALEVSRLGLGIKVSQDGGITGFHDGKAAPAFLLM